MPTNYTPSARASRTVRIPSDGDPIAGAALLASIRQVADLTAYTRGAFALNYRSSQASLGFEVRDIVEGMGQIYDQPPFGDVREPTLLAVGPGVLRSMTGETWGDAGAAGSFYGAAYSTPLARWVAVGSTLVTSQDTFAWTTPTQPGTATLRDVCADDEDAGQFVAVGDATLGMSYVLRSTDGLAWSQSVSPFEEPLYQVDVFESVFVAVGGTEAVPRAMYSEDAGDNWTEAYLPGDTGALRGLTRNADGFIAVTQSGKILRSGYGDAWDLVPGVQLGAHDLPPKIAADPVTGVVVAVDGSRGKLAVSFDSGLTFDSYSWLSAGAAVFPITALSFVQGRFIAGANNGYIALGLRR